MANTVLASDDTLLRSTAGKIGQFAVTEGDIERLVPLINAANVADGVDKQTDVEDLTREFTMPLSDPLTQVIVAEAPGGEFVGYAWVLTMDDPSGAERIYQFALKVHPACRGKGLDDELAARLTAMVRRTRAIPSERLSRGVDLIEYAYGEQCNARVAGKDGASGCAARLDDGEITG